MAIATVQFTHAAHLLERRNADAVELHDAVMTAFYHHFQDYRVGAAAQSEYRAVQASIKNDECLTLFDVAQTMQAGLDAHPAAREWGAFEQEAGQAIAPFSFSIRFSGEEISTTYEENHHG